MCREGSGRKSEELGGYCDWGARVLYPRILLKRGDKNDILENMQKERKITQLVRTYVHTYNYGLSIGVGGGDESPPMDLYSEVARYIRMFKVSGQCT